MRLLGKALTFDDVLLVPAFSQVLPRDTSLATRLSRNIRLNLPLVSAAMDTVTEARLAIAMAQEGGIGIVHKNLTPKQQAAEVARVKRYESGVLRDPITITPDDDGARGDRAVAASTASRASRCSTAARWSASSPTATCASRPASTRRCSEIMTPRETPRHACREGATLAEGKALMHKHKLERVLVVNDAFELRGPDDGQGHHQADQLSERRARRARQAARRRRGRRGRGHRGARRAARRRPASTSSSSTPRTATAPA